MLGELIDNPRSTIPKHVSDYFKRNLLDSYFVGKHGLTFEDKDVFTMIVVLEEVFHGIVEFSINSLVSSQVYFQIVIQWHFLKKRECGQRDNEDQ